MASERIFSRPSEYFDPIEEPGCAHPECSDIGPRQCEECEKLFCPAHSVELELHIVMCGTCRLEEIKEEARAQFEMELQYERAGL